jgi:hypothetical protein
MKRNHLAVGLLALLLVVFVCGCVRQTAFEPGHFERAGPEPSNSFIGVWENRTLTEGSGLPATITFEEGGTGMLYMNMTPVEFEYGILDNRTLNYTEEGESPVALNYWFSSDDLLVLEMSLPEGRANITWNRVVFKSVDFD